MSGILQQGYSLGYVFAACANLGVGGDKNSWKIVFWIAGKLLSNTSHSVVMKLISPVPLA
jgi:hypothetical protein